MSIDWRASKEEWAESVLTGLVPRLLADRRFISSERCVARFRKSLECWRSGGKIRDLINDANELAAAAALLDWLQPDAALHYEPRLLGTPKTIDFMIAESDATRHWIDMKTVAPLWQDDDAAWERLIKIAEDFPANSSLVVDRQFCGAAIGSQMLNTRWSFVSRTAELEAKITLLAEQERSPVRLLLCSDGSWHQDDLEDFADFYRTGEFRPDDWAQNAIARYMAERNIVFSGSIAGFCFLERHHDDIDATHLIIDVHGPTL